MPRHLWTVLCAGLAIDHRTNKASLWEIAEQFEVRPLKSEPLQVGAAVSLKLHVVSLWMRDDVEVPETAKYRLRLMAPSDQQPDFTSEMEIDLSGKHVRSRNYFIIEKIPYYGDGCYWFVIELQAESRWMEITRQPLVLTTSTPPN